jgi:hypothetical protein
MEDRKVVVNARREAVSREEGRVGLSAGGSRLALAPRRMGRSERWIWSEGETGKEEGEGAAGRRRESSCCRRVERDVECCGY